MNLFLFSQTLHLIQLKFGITIKAFVCLFRKSAVVMLSRHVRFGATGLRYFSVDQLSTAEVRVVEVGPRDGLQNEPSPVPLPVKVSLIERLTGCGLRHVECASFVSARWVPQMADSAGVMERLRRVPGVTYGALVPNERGLKQALDSRVDEVAVFVSVSEKFSRRNINCSVEESLRRAAPVVEGALAAGLQVRGYVSCVCGCPYEGTVRPESVARLAEQLQLLGCHQLSLGDTIGVGTAGSVAGVVREVLAAGVPLSSLAVHCHDTYGQALSNVLAALQLGVTAVDAAVGGLGGCPYAPGASGNLATEDLVYMLHGLGVHTGVDLVQLALTGDFICRALNRPNCSRAGSVIARQQQQQQQ